MTGDQELGLVWGLGWIALVGSALFARRVPRARMIALAVIWLGIFGSALILVSAVTHQRSDAASAPDRKPPLVKLKLT